jgi:hypothetical protein
MDDTNTNTAAEQYVQMAVGADGWTRMEPDVREKLGLHVWML